MTHFRFVGLATLMTGRVLGYARVVRGLVLSLRERGFVDAARALGATDRRIVLHHIVPSILPSVTVLASLEMGELVLAVSALSFLGLGVQPPTPEWGAMLNDGRTFFFTAPQLMLYPGLVISVAVLGFKPVGRWTARRAGSGGGVPAEGDGIVRAVVPVAALLATAL